MENSKLHGGDFFQRQNCKTAKLQNCMLHFCHQSRLHHPHFCSNSCCRNQASISHFGKLLIFHWCAQPKLRSCTDISLAIERELFSILLRLDQLEGFEIDFMVISTLDVISAKIKIIVINHQDDHQSWIVLLLIFVVVVLVREDQSIVSFEGFLLNKQTLWIDRQEISNENTKTINDFPDSQHQLSN